MAARAPKLNDRLFRVLRRVAQPTVERAVRDSFFDVYLRERLYRQEFWHGASFVIEDDELVAEPRATCNSTC